MPSVRKNYLYNLASQMLTILLPVITTPYITRVLGNENVGIFNYAQSIVNYFILFGCIGLNDYSQREIASCKGNGTLQLRVFYEVMLVRVVTVSVSFAIYWMAVVETADFPAYYAAFSLELLAALVDVSWFFQGKENFRSQTLRTMATRLLGILGIFLFVRNETDLWVYILCCACGILAGNLSLWPVLIRQLRRIPMADLRPWRHIRGALAMFLPQIAISVYTQLDKTMLGLLTGYDYAQVGYYSQAEKIVKLAMTVVTSLGSVMLSRMTFVLRQGGTARAEEYLHKSLEFACLLGWPIAVGLAVTAEDLVPWFFGQGYEPVARCMIALSPLVLIIATGCVFGRYYLIPAGKMKSFTATVVLGMAVNVALNGALIPKFGAIGAVAATLVSETAVTLSQFLWVRKMFPSSAFRAGRRNMAAALAMGAAVAFLASLLPPATWATAVEVLVGVAVYFGVLLLWKDPFLLRNLALLGGRKNTGESQ